MRMAQLIGLVLLVLSVAACGSRPAPTGSSPATAATAAVASPITSAPADATTPGPASTPPTTGEAPNVLAGTTWQWVGLTDPTQQVQIENPASYTITFLDATNLSIKADCNMAAGTYTAGADGALTIMPGATTLAACPPGSRGDEFLQKLSGVALYFFKDERLFMDMFADSGTLEFARFDQSAAAGSEEGAKTLVGTTWQWIELSDPTQQVAIENPAAYTIAFAEDSTVNIKADCNQAAGTYSANSDGALTITVGLSTMAACPPGSRGDEFLQKLGAVTLHSFSGEQLWLELMADGGTLKLTPLK